ncbi:GTP-binding protein [Fomitiporia mediterranea MF3/22]|uniref:GTP-binding protein n=1 Tax=Fomitiporia mediterranea (strain MF3/22) TaxID=694068 RepID=UPI0004408FAD|nr:GTP-binding protein [Fomitiporia mediterranea MF3/22]EJD00815.1 GTP-binding protein [Fomitiporia mediterranea MF3/22]
MGLLTIIRKNRMKEKEMRILFLGLDNAGKTTIVKKLNGEDVMSVSPTLGFNIKTFIHGRYTLNIWDVGGQRTLRPYWRNYFEQTDAVVWVVDSSDRMRMDDCKEELHKLLTEDRLAGASLLIFANKQDIDGAMSESEIRDALDLPSIRSHNWRIWSCSAMSGLNLVEGLDWAVGDVAQRLYYSSTVVQPLRKEPADLDQMRVELMSPCLLDHRVLSDGS